MSLITKLAQKFCKSPNLKEIRFCISNNVDEHQGFRSFIQNNYKELKAANPNLPLLTREGGHHMFPSGPYVTARFNTIGVKNSNYEVMEFVSGGASEEEVCKAVTGVMERGDKGEGKLNWLSNKDRVSQVVPTV